MVKILDLLCNSEGDNKRYTFQKSKDVFNITDEQNEIGAEIDYEGNIAYFVTGCYNSGKDWVEVDLDALMELKQLCEGLSENLIS